VDVIFVLLIEDLKRNEGLMRVVSGMMRVIKLLIED
jgi:hypothetical protein